VAEHLPRSGHERNRTTILHNQAGTPVNPGCHPGLRDQTHDLLAGQVDRKPVMEPRTLAHGHREEKAGDTEDQEHFQQGEPGLGERWRRPVVMRFLTPRRTWDDPGRRR
jgi:hypothetical protein